MAKRKTNEEFIKEVYELAGDEYTFLGEYTNARTKIKCRHNKCGYEWEIVPYSFLRGSGCPQCNRPNYYMDTDKFKERVYALVGDEYSILGEYIKSSLPIEIMHNKCGHKYKVKPNNFFNGCRCPQCVRPNYNRDNNQFVSEVYGLVGDEYTFIDEYVNNSTKLLCRHNKCGYEYKVAPFHFLANTRCPKCAGNLKKTTKDFIKEIYGLVGNEYTVLETYKNARTGILFVHNKCGHKWRAVPESFLRGTRCPICSKMRRTNEEFITEVYEIVGDEYTFLEEYTNTRTKIQCRHNVCGYEWSVSPSNILRGCRCPQCSESQGEKRVRAHLEEKDVSFRQEYHFSDLKGVGNGLLRFDFGIFNNENKLVFLVEYDGIFHYEKIYDDNGYEDLQIHDKRKNEYCKDNNIPLLRIPYWESDSIEKILDKWLNKYNLIL